MEKNIKEFLLNNTFNYINTKDDIVDVKIVSIEHYYENYYIAYFYYIENGVEKIEYMYDGGLYIEGDYAYLYHSVEEAQVFELSKAIVKIKIK